MSLVLVGEVRSLVETGLTDPDLQAFVERLTQVNRGRAYFASPDNLGEFILADYIRHRRRRVH